ncbi:hypothetical protein [Candidatus Ichthyocystis hellenicum]|nr:hypothetical protein [Candidatus Ichthyocystis hellenicum]
MKRHLQGYRSAASVSSSFSSSGPIDIKRNTSPRFSIIHDTIPSCSYI